MKTAKYCLGALMAAGLAVSIGCEADVDTASNQPPSNVTIENRYEDRNPDVTYSTPERRQDIRIETSEQNDFDIEADDPDDRDWEEGAIKVEGDADLNRKSDTRYEVYEDGDEREVEYESSSDTNLEIDD